MNGVWKRIKQNTLKQAKTSRSESKKKERDENNNNNNKTVTSAKVKDPKQSKQTLPEIRNGKYEKKSTQGEKRND